MNLHTASKPVSEYGCTIYGRVKKENEKFLATTHIIEFSINENVKEEPLGPHKAIRDLIFSTTEGLGPNSWVSPALSCPENTKHINFPCVRLSALTNDIIFNAIAGAAQSDDVLTTCQRFKMVVVTIEDLEGGGSRILSNIETLSRRSVVAAKNVKNKTLQPLLDGMGLKFGHTAEACVFFAVVVGMGMHEEKEKYANKWKCTLRQTGQRFSKKVAKLIGEVGLDFSHGAGTVILQKLDEIVSRSNYKLIVYEGLTDETKIYGTPYEEGDEDTKKIFLYYDRQTKHYSTILSVKAFFNKSHWCDHCEKVMENQVHANCKGSVCTKCQSHCKIEEFGDLIQDIVPCPITCSDCNFTFVNLKCYTNHKSELCSTRVLCDNCHCVYNKKLLKDADHKCNTTYCQDCKKYMDVPHYCFIKKTEQKKNMQVIDENTIYFASDFETTQDEQIELAGGRIVNRHNANLVNTAPFCALCRKKEEGVEVEPCVKCGPGEKSFDNFDDASVSVEKSLLDYVNQVCSARTLSNGTKMPTQQAIIIMHNSKAFDGHLVLRHVINNPDYIVESVIMSGLLILVMKLIHKYSKVAIKVLDFVCFAPAPLASLPKSFKIANVEKGHFPHLFNKRENYDYNGAMLPPLDDFDPDNMPTEKRDALIDWYTQTQEEMTEKGGTYNFKDEIRKYCANDVYILKIAVIAYREMFVAFNVDPFQESFTLASLANTVLRRNFYEDKAIGIQPKSDSYRSSQSIEALKWLVWLVKDNNLPNLKYAGNGTEQVLHGAPVDGYDVATNTVYQFHGDFWHGVCDCYKNLNSVKNPKTRQELQLRKVRTEARTKLLRGKGFTVVEMHECKWKAQMAADPDTYKRLNEDPIVVIGYLRSRDAFFGGRTNATKLMYKVKPGEIIRLVDFKSLYPTVNKWMQYPAKHPTVYTKDFPPLLEVNGVVRCKVDPPGNLYHPVLPEKIDSKLLFHLCSKCAREKKDPFCTHSDEERAITGSWISYELHLALKMGYTISELYEIWDYPETRQYNKETGENGLFNQYVDIFLKMKQVSLRFNINITLCSLLSIQNCESVLTVKIDFILFRRLAGGPQRG